MPAEGDTFRKPLWALGLMSGTSLDGVDAALLRTDGATLAEPGPWLTAPYDEATRGLLRSALSGEAIGEAERALTEAHAVALRDLLRRAGKTSNDVAVAGFPGHTLLHEPEAGITWQIGDGARLAELIGIDVVSDFRRRDVAAGGQGAPFAPLYHRALAHGLERPLAVLNIGGVANVTWIGADDRLIAFDTGPGCAPIDDWVLGLTGETRDEGGALARCGTPDAERLAELKGDGYFARPPPKSLDRNAFDRGLVEGLSAADGAATLCAFTAWAAGQASRHFPAPPKRWLVTGGGRHNLALMEALRRELPEAEVLPVEEVGWAGDALEAQAFAFLAVRSLRGLPLSLPETTGVGAPVTGGALHRQATRKD